MDSSSDSGHNHSPNSNEIPIIENEFYLIYNRYVGTKNNIGGPNIYIHKRAPITLRRSGILSKGKDQKEIDMVAQSMFSSGVLKQVR
jgi:hypothetical protein